MIEYIVPIDDLKAIVEGRDIEHDLKILVRCKDCKYWNPHIKECEGIVNWFGLANEWSENGFCFKGERKEDIIEAIRKEIEATSKRDFKNFVDNFDEIVK